MCIRDRFPTEFIIGLLAASIAGGAVGLERETSNKSAGLRTNMLVSVGSSVFVMISAYLMEGIQTGDPSRVMGQIVTGIGSVSYTHLIGLALQFYHLYQL